MRKLAAILVLLSLCTTSSVAQMRTSRGNSIAEVDSSAGRISFSHQRYDTRLTYKNKSFLGVRVGTKSFANHDALPANVFELGSHSLSKEKDSLISLWKNSECEIRQSVSPVFEGDAAKILVRFYVRNTTSSPKAASCSYLLDLAVGDDGPQILSKNSSFPLWSRVIGDSVFHTAFFEDEALSPPSFDADLSAEAIWKSATIPLERPRQVTIGDWRVFEPNFPHLPSKLPTTNIEDGAIVAEWGEKTIQPGSMVEIGSFIFGAGYYEQCIGNFVGFVFPMSDLKLPVDWQGDTVATLAVYLTNAWKQHIEATNTELTLKLDNGLGVFDGTDLKTEQTIHLGSLGREMSAGHIFALGRFNSSDSLKFDIDLDVSSSLPEPALGDCKLEYTLQRAVASVKSSAPTAESIVLYPNPSSESVLIEGLKSLEYDLQIIDLTGREIFVGSIEGPQARLDLTSFASGSYRLLLRNRDENYSLPLVITRAQN